MHVCPRNLDALSGASARVIDERGERVHPAEDEAPRGGGSCPGPAGRGKDLLAGPARLFTGNQILANLKTPLNLRSFGTPKSLTPDPESTSPDNLCVPREPLINRKHEDL